MDLHLRTFMRSLRRMRENEAMTDVTLKLPDESTIACHKLILMAASSFFESMFQSGLKESIDNYVKLEFTDSDTIRALVEYIYSGEIEVNKENVQTLVAASEFLFLEDLKANCDDYLATLIQSSNHQDLRDFGQKFNLKKLLSSTHEFYLSHFQEMIETPSFTNLTEEELVALVSDDRLNAKSEDMVFESVVQWVKEDPEQRKEAFPRIAPLIRFPLCTQKTLTKIVNCEQLMWNAECMRLVSEAQQSQFHAGINRVDNSRTTPRGNKTDYLVRVFNDERGYVNFESTMEIDVTEVVEDMEPLEWMHPLEKEYYATVAQHRDPADFKPPRWEVNTLDFNIDLTKGKVQFVSNGIIWIIVNDCRISVDIKSKKITAHPWKNPSVGWRLLLTDHAVVSVSGKRIESFNKSGSGHQWRCERLLKEVSSPLLIHLPDLCLEVVYIIEGNVPNPNPNPNSRTTQKFHLRSGSCSMCCSMPGECTDGQAVGLNSQIYVLGGKERVCFRYDPSKDTWSVLSRPPHASTSAASVVVWRGNIILKDSHTQVYNPAIDCWSVREGIHLFNGETYEFATKLLCVMRL